MRNSLKAVLFGAFLSCFLPVFMLKHISMAI